MENSDLTTHVISEFITDLSPSNWVQYIVSSFLALAALYLTLSIVPQPTQPTLIQAYSILLSDWFRLLVVSGVIIAMGVSVIVISILLNNKRKALTDIELSVFFNRAEYDKAGETRVRQVIEVINEVMRCNSLRWGEYQKLVKKAGEVIKLQEPSPPPSTPTATLEQAGFAKPSTSASNTVVSN